MIVSQIAAMASNRVIGVNNRLPWNIPEDTKFFRETTKKKIIIMGRKTFESLNSKPLPGRFNIVISRNKNFNCEGAILVSTIEAAIELAKGKTAEWGQEVFVIGGAEIYKLALPYTNKIYLTEINKSFEGETKFPEFDKNLFKIIARSERTDPIPYAFVTYQRESTT